MPKINFSDYDYGGVLFCLKNDEILEEMYATLSNGIFDLYTKAKPLLPASHFNKVSSPSYSFSIVNVNCTCQLLKMSRFDLSRILHDSKLNENFYFFVLTLQKNVNKATSSSSSSSSTSSPYLNSSTSTEDSLIFATIAELDRTHWLRSFRALSKGKIEENLWISTSFLDSSYLKESYNRFSSAANVPSKEAAKLTTVVYTSPSSTSTPPSTTGNSSTSLISTSSISITSSDNSLLPTVTISTPSSTSVVQIPSVYIENDLKSRKIRRKSQILGIKPKDLLNHPDLTIPTSSSSSSAVPSSPVKNLLHESPRNSMEINPLQTIKPMLREKINLEKEKNIEDNELEEYVCIDKESLNEIPIEIEQKKNKDENITKRTIEEIDENSENLPHNFYKNDQKLSSNSLNSHEDILTETNIEDKESHRESHRESQRGSYYRNDVEVLVEDIVNSKEDDEIDEETLLNYRNSIEKKLKENLLYDMTEKEKKENNFLHGEKRFFGIKLLTINKFFNIVTTYPFILIITSLNLTADYKSLRSNNMIRLINILIFIILPIFYVNFLLKAYYKQQEIYPLLILILIGFNLLPVALIILRKIKIFKMNKNAIVEGTFCFKPSNSVSFTYANFYALLGFFMEYYQHIYYVLPNDLFDSDSNSDSNSSSSTASSTVSSFVSSLSFNILQEDDQVDDSNEDSAVSNFKTFLPLLPYQVYFYLAVVATIICSLIIILNSVIRGKNHYKFQNSYIVWYSLYFLGSPLFVTIITILFMGLTCNYSTNPVSLLQDEDVHCFGAEHRSMARTSLITLSFYIIQHTLLPSGTFKETMREDDLEIMFIPLYLQGHYILKVFFSLFYVLCYDNSLLRVISLTIINCLLLILNNFMKPCSVGWVNLLRDCFLFHATLTGILSTNYLLWTKNEETKGIFFTSLFSTLIFTSICAFIYFLYTKKKTEFVIAIKFLELEWQVSRGGNVDPRVLEPLISLTLSKKPSDREISIKYIGQLIWLLSYPNVKVQFQSAWGLANIALIDDESRQKINDFNGVDTLFKWYKDMEPLVQLECLAALANLTLSENIVNNMVNNNKCIPFFINLISSNKIKHCEFSIIALGNIAKYETHRELIHKSGGLPVLINCLMSNSYNKRRHASRALANMALTESKDIIEFFNSVVLIKRLIKMALRKEIETIREVTALLRILSSHKILREVLFSCGILEVIDIVSDNIFEDVQVWGLELKEIFKNYQNLENNSNNEKHEEIVDLEKNPSTATDDLQLLSSMKPLEGRVDWLTWGSKLDTIFEVLFSMIPTINSSNYTIEKNNTLSIFLPNGITPYDLLKIKRDTTISYIIIKKPSHGILLSHSEEKVYPNSPSSTTTASSNSVESSGNNSLHEDEGIRETYVLNSECIDDLAEDQIESNFVLTDIIEYKPDPDYSGTDLIIYKMMIGTSIMTNSATITINVLDNLSYSKRNIKKMKKNKKENSRTDSRDQNSSTSVSLNTIRNRNKDNNKDTMKDVELSDLYK